MTKTIDRFRGEYDFLSNFYPSPIKLPTWHPAFGAVAPTIEHAFQAAKTEDRGASLWIIEEAHTPGAAKKMGRKVSLRAGWNEARVGVMKNLVAIKFSPGTELAQKLLDTGDTELIEGNNWGDRFWGQVNGEGENHLGLILMEIRSSLALSEAS